MTLTVTPEEIIDQFENEIAHKRVEVAWNEAIIQRCRDSIGNYDSRYDIRYDKCVVGEYECRRTIERLLVEIGALEVVLGLLVDS